MKKLYFILGIHNHQPVGNFLHVIEKGFQDAYWPFMELLSKHPKIKWSLHCSGVLWDFFKEKHPEYIKAVKDMLDLGQLELLTGGYYEPIIPSIPDVDKKGQIKKLTEFLKKEFKFKARGMWLTERVWEPHLAKVINESGVEYTVVDDAHFAASGFDVEKLKGYYTTEEEGTKLNIFPISQKLRYYIPFQTVEKTIEYMSSFADETGNCAIVMADDGEKFGMWPETNKHVYKNGWLENFLKAVEKNLDWIEPITFSEYLDKFSAKGRAYLPCASYFEMSEWALPQDAQEVFEGVTRQFENNPQAKRFLRGGFWRNFLSKYDESNNMHKKMLYVSSKVNELKKKSDENSEIFDALYAGQCNCAYWHGVFGGLYLPHLRTAVYKELIKAESLFFRKSGHKTAWKEMDFDCDGRNEVIYESSGQNIYFSPHNGGTIFEWDFIPKEINVLNVLTRRREAYHKRLKEFLSKTHHQASEIRTIHDFIRVKEVNLDRFLTYDWYRRASLVDHFLHPNTKFDELRKGQYAEQGDFVLGAYAFKIEKNKIIMKRDGIVWENQNPLKVNIEKAITPSKTGLNIIYKIKNLEKRNIEILFAPEFNYAFSSFVENDNAELKSVNKWMRKDEHFKFTVEMIFSSSLDLNIFPLETVSLSEGGFEKTHQGTVVIPIFKLNILENGVLEQQIKIKITD
ncbi:MAG: DUF1926 domain-containing protein [Elusimicrobia bacterium]|nr:DUF1926 domain-containing protein [Elusimicrobiota bacterium]